MVSVNWNYNLLFDEKGKEHKLSSNDFWHIAPFRFFSNPKNIKDLPIMRHNAKIRKGIVIAMSDLLSGISAHVEKLPHPKKVEEIFEKIRLHQYPHRPSRLRCHFLSLTEAHAKTRQEAWGWKENRKMSFDIKFSYIPLC